MRIKLNFYKLERTIRDIFESSERGTLIAEGAEMYTKREKIQKREIDPFASDYASYTAFVADIPKSKRTGKRKNIKLSNDYLFGNCWLWEHLRRRRTAT